MDTRLTNVQLLKSSSERLKNAGITEHDTDAWLLFAAAFDMTRTDYILHMNDVSDKTKLPLYEEYLRKRESRIPVQYILHSAPFMGYDFFVDENVLIPRMDTEVLVSEAVSCIKKSLHQENGDARHSALRILDMCTGSGCIAISTFLELKATNISAKVDAVDISQGALEVARKNVGDLNVDVTCISSNLFDKIEGKYDYILSNPPYIRTDVVGTLEPEVREHEPMLALDGTEDGLYFYRKISKEAVTHLNSDGYIFYEIGYDQGKDVSDILKEYGYSDVRVLKDLAGLDRVVCAKLAL